MRNFNFFLKVKKILGTNSLLTFLAFILFFSSSGDTINAQVFAPLGSGATSTVRAVTLFNGDLIVAGDFTTAGGQTVNRIARWNGSNWSSLGTGMNGNVNAVVVFANDLYAAGSFTTAGGVTVNRVARWNGSSWSALGLGLNGTANALEVFAGDLYVGGSFTTAGGITVNRVARWDGSWSALGSGTGGTVNSLRAYNNSLYVGGSFTTIGGIPVSRIARWDGGNWFQLGSGITSGTVVYALTVYNNNLIVGGFFTGAGGISANGIAAWNGSSWGNLGTGVGGGSVRAFTTYLGELYLGGFFTSAGGNTVNRIARWNGSAYSGLGGASSIVYALGTHEATLIAGGSFTTIGGIGASRIAKWGSVPVSPTLLSPPNNSVGVGLTPLLEWTSLNNAFSYGIQLSDDPNFNTTIINESGLTNPEYSIPSGAINPGTVYFWKANASNGMGTSGFSTIFFFTSILTNIGTTGTEIPDEFNLYTNYPNPFNPTTKIRFDIPSVEGGTTAKLVVFDQVGREVKTLINEAIEPGKYEYVFDGSNLSSGVYYYKLVTDRFVETRKMILVK